MAQYPSKTIEKAVEQLSRLPGVGSKSALRLALYLLRQDADMTKQLSESLVALRTLTEQCVKCHNYADQTICEICDNHFRDHHTICVVQDARDVIAIENTAQYRGLYHVLGGVISPLEGVHPDHIQIGSLLARIQQATADGQPISEVILALSPTMEGDTTAFYLTRKLKDFSIKLTTIARGVPTGGELEYADEVTLGRSILQRTLADK